MMSSSHHLVNCFGASLLGHVGPEKLSIFIWLRCSWVIFVVLVSAKSNEVPTATVAGRISTDSGATSWAPPQKAQGAKSNLISISSPLLTNLRASAGVRY